jgi:hypothetical protein
VQFVSKNLYSVRFVRLKPFKFFCNARLYRAQTLRLRIDSSARSAYSDPLRMINSIAKKKPVASAEGRHSGWVGEGSRDLLDAAHRASAPTINPFMAATRGIGTRW